jgi:hopanoid C-3 methylase
VYNADLLLADHALPVRYEIPLPPAHRELIDAKTLYIHTARGRRVRGVDPATERFVELGALQAQS